MSPPPNPSDPEDADAPDSSALVARKEEELRVRGYSPRTLESYLAHLRRFLRSPGRGTRAAVR